MNNQNICAIDVRSSEYSVISTLPLNPDIFNCDYFIDSMWDRFRPVHEVVRWQDNKKREAIQCVKNRSQVSGAHRKIRPQKESGKARQGDGKACHFRGGGAAFAINSRNYEFSLNKKFKSLAKKIVLSHKFMNQGMVVFEDLTKCDLSKTKSVLEFIKNIKQERILFVVNEELYKSPKLHGIKNLYKVDAICVRGLNVKSMLDRALIFDLASIKELEKNLSKKSELSNE